MILEPCDTGYDLWEIFDCLLVGMFYHHPQAYFVDTNDSTT